MKTHQIIQGGMGIAVSSWHLARTVSLQNQIGIVSSTAIDLVLIRTLQQGDPEGHIRRALQAFPDQDIVQKILDRYFIAGGKPVNQPYKNKPMIGDKPSRFAQQLIVVSNFVEVYLAKEGHDGTIGINFLHKIQTPILAGIYGAMLAGVDVIVVGAGIPLDIPNIIQCFSEGKSAELVIHVHNASKDRIHQITFDPVDVLSSPLTPPKRPLFYPIVSSVTLATLMVKKCPGQIDGLIIEEPSAGGHNAPPRGKTQLNEKGEPIYGSRDEIKYDAIKALGLPFWLAGSYAHPEKLMDAKAQGAVGIQLGSAFAFCQESGLESGLKKEIIKQAQTGNLNVFKDPLASPTGFPFQVLSVSNSLSEAQPYSDRCRQCDLGYLREAYERPDGSLGWRCKSEDPQEYVKKGGNIEDTIGRKCLCNSLMANIGLAQIRENALQPEELPLITCGQDLTTLQHLTSNEKLSYSATEVIHYVLDWETQQAADEAYEPIEELVH